MSWKAVDLGENEAVQEAMDLDVVFDSTGSAPMLTAAKFATRSRLSCNCWRT